MKTNIKLKLICLIIVITFFINVIPAKTNNDYIEEIIGAIDVSMIEEYVQVLQDFGPKVTQSEACFQAEEYMFNKFQQIGLSVQYRPWSYEGYEDRNVEAILPGENEESVILFGHIDTVDGSPGADDNGAGIAAILAAAETIKENMGDTKPFYTIRFVAFSGKEQGKYGSICYVDELINQNIPVISAIESHLIGNTGDGNDGRYNVILYRDRFISDWISDVSENVSIMYNDLIQLTINRKGINGFYDSKIFADEGYFTASFREYDFNTFAHSPGDTIDKLNIDYAKRVTRLITGTIIQIANKDFVNRPPNDPEAPSGPSSARHGMNCNFSVSTIDPEENQIYYFWDWGDGNTSGWIGPYATFPKKQKCEISYCWSERGNYQVKVKAKDIHGEESNWSDPLQVTMTKNINFKNNQFIRFSSILKQRYCLFDIIWMVMNL